MKKSKRSLVFEGNTWEVYETLKTRDLRLHKSLCNILKEMLCDDPATIPWRIRSVIALPGYRLSVTCNDGTTGVVDMSQLVFSEKAGIFAALKDEHEFKQVYIELGALTWPSGADFDPAWLHEEIGKHGSWLVPG